MKQCLILITFLLGLCATGQNRSNWWFFGENAGLNFSQAGVVPVQGELNTFEGCSAISSVCGELLFYSDGSTVWDRNGTIMPNGSNLLGDPSSTQSAIIVPLPENDHMFYIFTVAAIASIDKGLHYSVVDMTLNNGLGDIMVSQKNINLLSNSSEKIVATRHSNGVDAWIIAYGETIPNSTIYDRFHAFKLTPSGIDETNTIESSSVTTRTTEGRGYMKISPDGNKIAMMTPGLIRPGNPNAAGLGAWLFEFNNTTGGITGSVRLEFPFDLNAYGAEFSSDSSKIYVDLNTGDGGMQVSNGLGERSLYQYDLNIQNFELNPFIIYQTSPQNPTDDHTRGALQRGPDQKIYYTRDRDPWLSVIHNPNASGTSCNFDYNGVRLLSGTLATEGLPPFYNFQYIPEIRAEINCVGLPTIFTADALAQCPNTTVLWNFGNPAAGSDNISVTADSEFSYSAPGTYTVTLDIQTVLDSYSTSTIINIPVAAQAFEIDDHSYCQVEPDIEEVSIDLVPFQDQALGGQSPTVYQVKIYDNVDDASLDINDLGNSANLRSGTYYARVNSQDLDGCFEIAAFNINIIPFIETSTPADLIECDGIENDGSSIFDIRSHAEDALMNLNPEDLAISIHDSRQDAEATINELPSLYENTDPREELFVRYTYNDDPECPQILSFFIEVSYLPNIPFIETLTQCDDVSRDGVEFFNLQQITDQIQNAQSGNISALYYATEEDAVMQTSPLEINYQNTDPTEQIWVRVSNPSNESCFEIAPVDLELFERPEAIAVSYYLKCFEETITISALSGYNHYLWNTGANTASISVVEAGSYEVEVTDFNGCTSNASIVVENFDQIEIEELIISQFRVNRNSIEVLARGNEPLLYSLDNFMFQEQNIFENLLPGNYDVYVKDATGCEIATADASIIAAPQFFTPNDDGYNDRWHITGIETIPEAQIFIFDRFGKLLAQLDPLGQGWNGRFNSNPMPSNDYWFTVSLPDGSGFKGHFTLKR